MTIKGTVALPLPTSQSTKIASISTTMAVLLSHFRPCILTQMIAGGPSIADAAAAAVEGGSIVPEGVLQDLIRNWPAPQLEAAGELS